MAFPSPFPSVSFTRKPEAGVQTLDALMARQKELAARQAELSGGGYPGEGTIAGGLGNMVNQLFTGMGQYNARQAEQEGRQQLTQAITGIDPNTGIATPEQLSTVMGRDPDLGLALYQQAMQARLAQRQAELAAAQRKEDRSWSVEDRDLALSAAERQRQQGRGWAVEDREDTQAAAAELAKARQDEWIDIAAPEGSKPGSMWQRNTRTGQVASEGGTSLPTTATDRKALWAQQDEYINTADTIAKLNEAKGLLDQGIDWGNMAGLRTWSSGTGWTGEERQALATRTKQYNAIMRQEAIAAMSQALKGATTDTEMQEFITNMNDPALDPKIKAQQIDNMLRKARAFNELQADRIVEMGGNPPKNLINTEQQQPLPEGVTEADIEATMKANNMTREQVLERLRQQPGG